MRLEPIQDPDGDERDAQDRLDRALDKASLDYAPIDPCPTCGVQAKEIAPSHWACACTLPVGTAA